MGGCYNSTSEEITTPTSLVRKISIFIAFQQDGNFRVFRLEFSESSTNGSLESHSVDFASAHKRLVALNSNFAKYEKRN